MHIQRLSGPTIIYRLNLITNPLNPIYKKYLLPEYNTYKRPAFNFKGIACNDNGNYKSRQLIWKGTKCWDARD